MSDNPDAHNATIFRCLCLIYTNTTLLVLSEQIVNPSSFTNAAL